MSHPEVNRRELLAGAGAGRPGRRRGRRPGPVLLGRGRGKPKLEMQNADFYTGGKFDQEKAKDGIIKLCKHHGYPVFPDCGTSSGSPTTAPASS